MYRSAEVDRTDADLSDRPVIIVANHSAGFADPVLIMYGANRWPRFLAKATLWKTAAVGKVFDLAGVIPVHRAVDGGTGGNIEAFADCYGALRNNEVIAIFPEGRIHQESTIGDIHTGAARIALGARASGAAGVAIVPVGLYYEGKPGRRGRVYAKVGELIDLDADIDLYVDPGEDDDGSNRDAVVRLTNTIAASLRAVAPDYSSEGEWRVLSAAAEVTLRSRQYDTSVPVSFGRREELARELQSASPQARLDVLRTAERYGDLLKAQNLRDINVASHASIGSALPDHTVRSLGTALALSPTAAAGLVFNIVPMGAMRLLSNNLRTNQLMKSTIQTLASPIVYAGAWAAWGVVLRRKGIPFGGTMAVLGGAIGGWALVLASERSDVVRDGLGGWLRLGGHSPGVEPKTARRELIEAVDNATG
jgi:glycerol-3-phosphate O-acyltransferase/dihydroxyacetone phosphate acyltransferase